MTTVKFKMYVTTVFLMRVLIRDFGEDNGLLVLCYQ